VIAPLVRAYGLDYLVATVLLAGVLQIVLSLLGVARLMRFVPRSVMIGFVNALAILIFTSQVVASLFFARRVARFTEVIDAGRPDADTRVYAVRGALFFASSNDLVGQFDDAGDPAHVVIDLSDAQIYDSSTVAGLDSIELRYRQRGKDVRIVGLDGPSRAWHTRLSGQLGAGS